MHTRADQLLSQLLIEHFDTLPTQCRHIEHMHEGVWFPKSIIIPPVYEVYRGYIGFAFFRTDVSLSVCLSVNFFFSSKISQKLLDLGF